jgi:hypothetical protein
MASPQVALLRQAKVWPVVLWCLPSLVGFVLFLVSFPIDRDIHLWPRVSLGELYALWFVFVTPITSAVAVVKLTKSRHGVGQPIKFLLWTAIALSIVANILMLLGMWASTY